ncbi:hypothetical protein BDY19DRAFT_514769 [Irpex rosettiformis]|uniref:Uncharacterized protein n=1 Tax=Irpex rosettiformis TaxID=378272 RepID=A0ACB8TRU1_9APHY|nr:hypothetical protein BDY19DRAFT_514769 [Irpex rosettiformis]
MSQQRQVTDTHHNDYVGSDANANRIPGTEQVTTGHHYVSVFPKEGPDSRNASGVNRADEHLPPPTGHDRPPRSINQPAIPAEQGSWGDGLTTVSSQSQSQPAALDSRTVIDRDPFSSPTSATDTLTGATSQDVYRGIGKPWGGQTSAELHHDGHTHRKRGLQGTDQYGTAYDLKRGEGADPWVGDESGEVNVRGQKVYDNQDR